LEKSLQKQEQKSNEISKELKLQKQKRNSKNLKGSHFTESVASPDHMTLTTRQNLKENPKKNMVDLTLDETMEQEPDYKQLSSQPPQKKQKQSQHRHGSQYNRHTTFKKTVHWKDKVTQQPLVHYQKNEKSSTQTNQHPPMSNNQPQQPPLFPQPPHPFQLLFPFQYYALPNTLNAPNSHQMFPNSNFLQQHAQTSNPFNQPRNLQKEAATKNPFLPQLHHQKY